MSTIKTLAELKRRVQVGTVFKLLETSVKANPFVGVERKVTFKGSTAITLASPDGRESWLEWPKAGELTFVNNSDGRHIIRIISIALLVYEIIFSE